MENDDFFDHFRNKDLSGIKKFNFKKTKNAKLPEKAFPSLKITDSGVSAAEGKSGVSSTRTFDFQALSNSSSSKCSFRKKEQTISNCYLSTKTELSSETSIFNYNSNESTTKILNNFKSTKKPEKGLSCKSLCTDTIITLQSKNEISSKDGKNDTILDSLYKNTISNKRLVDVTGTKKQSPVKHTLKEKDEFNAFALKPIGDSELSLSTKKSSQKTKDLAGSPSLLSGSLKLTTKGTFSISKYFDNENKTDVFKSNILSPCLTPFKKLLDAKKCVNITDGREKLNSDENIEHFVTDVIKQDSKFISESLKPLTISSSSSTTTESPINKPKKFVFKKRPLSSSSSLSLSQEMGSFNYVFGENECDSNEPISFGNDFIRNILPAKKNNLDLSCSTSQSKKRDNRDILGYNEIPDNTDFSGNDRQGGENVVTTRNNLNEEKIEESFGNSQSVLSSLSLEITNDDYMDDEEFEKRFGCLAEQLDESAFTSQEQDVSSSRASAESRIIPPSLKLEGHNTEELLNEISNINWDDDCFEDEPVQKGFKDRNDDSEEFKRNYEHTEVMLEVLHQKFGLRSFRPHQREVINASLTQHDCFVLMPTGGGKSLCYQLPAVLMPGVTVVISPLRALISDQVDKLNALDIAAAHLCSDVSKTECEQIYMKLSMREPAIKLLYLTPEKISASRGIMDILNSLYQRGKLARFVIDEVHCLSQWGHDFRPDYKLLSLLRTQYKDVPIICLTATATKQVEQDVIHILGLKEVKRFIRSFNRPNIKYQVIPKKGKGIVEEIGDLIKSKFAKGSGIVYCLGRKDCDTLAEKLNRLGIKSKPYHAGMNDKVREVIQREWMQDRFHVIVATIAFGMGIDKPDVRFVIHNSIPKSVEAFYQESGRAGRDGEVSYSYLFYSYGDAGRLLRLMQMDRNVSKKTLDAHKENLKQMVGFAENVVDCRRHLQLIHLGEHFDRRICIRNTATTCDNCENINKYKAVEVTKAAKELCTIVKDLTSGENVTMLYVADIYRGAKIKKILDRGHNKHCYYGAGANMDRNNVQRVLKELILKYILSDFCTYTGDFPVVYIKTGPKFYQFFNSNSTMTIPVCTDKQRKTEVVKVDKMDTVSNYDNTKDKVDGSKPSTSGVIRHTVQKQTTAKLQAARKLQLVQLKVQCHEELLEECRRLAMQLNLTLSSIMNLSAIKTMSDLLPYSKEEMLKIQHVTNANYSKYGEFFLKITRKFKDKHDALVPLTLAPKPDNEMGLFSDDDCQSAFYTSHSSRNPSGWQSRGAKRKRAWGSSRSRGVKRRRGGFRKTKGKASPKSKAATSSGWKGKGSRGGGGLGLMPLHIK